MNNIQSNINNPNINNNMNVNNNIQYGNVPNVGLND